jgi:phosphoribosylformylglycinamidine synthase PurS subunit
VKHRFEVIVYLKEGLLDPQGKAIEDALPALGWTNVSDVRVGKSIQLLIEADTEEAAEDQIADVAHRFLSNPVIERFHIRQAAEEAAS